MAKMIKLTAAISLGATLLLILLYDATRAGAVLSLAITAGTICYHFVMRLLVGAAVDGVMHNHADYHKAWYRPRAFEAPLYRILRVKTWKDKMPTYVPAYFSLGKQNFGEIAEATCQAEVVHEIIAILSFLPLLTVRWFGAFWVFFLTSFFSACFDLMFAVIQRYNRPRLVRLAERGKG